MALFVLGDPHLSLGASKPMDIFPGWNDYVERLEKNWRKLIRPEDTIVLAGDISWAMRLTDTRRDFAFLQSLPGQKIIMKGNHDYWWSTANKMNAYLKAEGFDTLHILHNNSYSVEGYAICGTRGWLFDVGEPHDEKVMNREIGRLRMSLDAAEPGLEKLVAVIRSREISLTLFYQQMAQCKILRTLCIFVPLKIHRQLSAADMGIVFPIPDQYLRMEGFDTVNSGIAV